MKSKMWLALVACAAIAAGGLSGSKVSWAQDESMFRTELPPEPSRRVRTFERVEATNPYGRPIGIVARPDSMREIEEAAARVRDAEGDEAKTKATKELAALLDKYFEDDMQRRADELAKIEERVKKLHALLEKRAAKKQEIIDLQIRVLENEAEGLGFFNEALPPGGSSLPMMLQQNTRPGFRGYGYGGSWIGTSPQAGMQPGARAGGGSSNAGSSVPGVAPPPQPARPAAPPQPTDVPPEESPFSE